MLSTEVAELLVPKAQLQLLFSLPVYTLDFSEERVATSV